MKRHAELKIMVAKIDKLSFDIDKIVVEIDGRAL
jgi:hypothetical protein